jgi:saccharopine dehydrogenase-like NADP-dependent oxidoreductase
MKKIFVAGAGLSSSSLIEYLLLNSEKHKWEIIVGDLDADIAHKKINGHINGKAIYFNVQETEKREEIISKVDLVISLLPVSMHNLMINTCLKFAKNILTASYASDELMKLNNEFINKGMTVIYECGLDPGIDHMSAMKIIHEIKSRSFELVSFKSSTGGLVAPEYDNNPWNYKFTWNPRNVVLAGKDGAQYLENGVLKLIPYNQLFLNAELLSIFEDKTFESYPNRDSLKYRSLYHIEDAETIYRGTIRKAGFSTSWNHIVQLGLTNDISILENSENLTYRELTETLISAYQSKNTETRVAEYLGIDPESEEMKKLLWLGLLSDKKISIPKATPAVALQKLLEEKWKLMPDETDMIVMQHEFIFRTQKNELRKITSSLMCKGKDKIHTAMSQTVGLPLGITAKLLLTGKIRQKGVVLPFTKEIYEPILEELIEFGIEFTENEEMIR